MANDSNIMTAKRKRYLCDLHLTEWRRQYDSQRAQRAWALKWGYIEALNGQDRITEKGVTRLGESVRAWRLPA